jgi:lycopene cyclase domain-containing protein
LSIAGPLTLSFDKKVAFFSKRKHIFRAMWLPALCFLIWDQYFTSIQVWSFNEEYITGWKIGLLPIEEVLFFITVPYCCLFVYECIRCYFPNLRDSRVADFLLILLGLILLVVGIINFEKAYTFYTFILLSLFIAILFLFKRTFKSFDALSFLISYAIIIIPFLIVNGFLTSIPVVLYNDAENLGIRIFSFLPSPMHNIPFEDVFYGMLLILMNVAFYEKSRGR